MVRSTRNKGVGRRVVDCSRRRTPCRLQPGSPISFPPLSPVTSPRTISTTPSLRLDPSPFVPASRSLLPVLHRSTHRQANPPGRSALHRPPKFRLEPFPAESETVQLEHPRSRSGSSSPHFHSKSSSVTVVLERLLHTHVDNSSSRTCERSSGTESKRPEATIASDEPPHRRSSRVETRTGRERIARQNRSRTDRSPDIVARVS